MSGLIGRGTCGGGQPFGRVGTGRREGWSVTFDGMAAKRYPHSVMAQAAGMDGRLGRGGRCPGFAGFACRVRRDATPPCCGRVHAASPDNTCFAVLARSTQTRVTHGRTHDRALGRCADRATFTICGAMRPGPGGRGDHGSGTQRRGASSWVRHANSRHRRQAHLISGQDTGKSGPHRLVRTAQVERTRCPCKSADAWLCCWPRAHHAQGPLASCVQPTRAPHGREARRRGGGGGVTGGAWARRGGTGTPARCRMCPPAAGCPPSRARGSSR